MLRSGRGSTVLTWRGASGAPITPSKSRRSEVRNEQPVAAAAEEEVTEGVRESWPRTQWPHPSLLWLPTSSGASPSGPSINGDSASPTGRKLDDLAIIGASASACTNAWWGCLSLPCPFRRRGLIRIALEEDSLFAAGLFVLRRAGDSPRTTSSSVEKNPCFFSMESTRFVAPTPPAANLPTKRRRWKDGNARFILSRTEKEPLPLYCSKTELSEKKKKGKWSKKSNKSKGKRSKW